MRGPIKLEKLLEIKATFSEEDLINDPTCGIPLNSLKLFVKTKPKSYDDVLELLNKIDMNSLSKKVLPYIRPLDITPNVLEYKAIPLGSTLSHAEIRQIENYCWYNWCNFSPGESVRIINYFETEKGLSAEITHNIFSYINYYPIYNWNHVSYTSPFAFDASYPTHLFYMLSDSRIDDAGKLFLKQLYYNRCVSTGNLEKLKLICPEWNFDKSPFPSFTLAEKTATIQEFSIPEVLISIFNNFFNYL